MTTRLRLGIATGLTLVAVVVAAQVRVRPGPGGWTDDGTAVYVTNTGRKVGIGTTSPSAKLEVDGKIRIGNDAAAPAAGTIRWTGTNFEGFDGSVWKTLDVQATSGGGWTEEVAGNKVYVTNTSRNVGIGTTGPGAKLDIQDSSNAQVNIFTAASNPANGGRVRLGSYTGGALQEGSEFLYDASANIYQLGGYGGATWRYGLQIHRDAPTGSIYVNSLGNVGIGTPGPNEKFEVNGGIRLNTTSAKPTCDASKRGTFWFTQGGIGVADVLEVCMKLQDGTYVWVVK
jgi:hypothetical protein